MQIKPNKRKAKSEARKLLKDFGFASFPLNLINLLNFLDLEYKEFDPRDLSLKNTDPNKVSAFIEYHESIIFYNKFHHKNRLRFSVAHEVGHYQLKHKSFPHPIVYNSKNPQESEANTFAAELLMPLSLLKTEKIFDENDVENLAKKYGVSKKAMLWRICTDNSLTGTNFDYLNSPKREEDDRLSYKDENDYSNIYPPSKDYKDNYDIAIDYYSTLDIDELKNLLSWIDEVGEEDEYPETYKAIHTLVKNVSK